MSRRVLSAAVGLPLLLLAAYFGGPVIGVLAIAAGLAAGYELAGMAAQHGVRRDPSLIAAPGVLAASGMLIAETGAWPAALLLAGATAAALAASLARARREPGGALRLLAAAGAIYYGALLAHAPAIGSLEHGAPWLLTALLATFAVDTAAFFTGRAIGRHRMAPALSPGKTWEGTVGGIVAGIAATSALAAAAGLPLQTWEAATLGLAVGVAAVAGDLIESALKRRAGVKDAGALIPGHGGILDRLDSLAPNLAVVYWMARWLSG